jgi:hypothetical protein
VFSYGILLVVIVQPLQSVKSIWIVVSAVLNELRFGFNTTRWVGTSKNMSVCDFGNKRLAAMCCGDRAFSNT